MTYRVLLKLFLLLVLVVIAQICSGSLSKKDDTISDVSYPVIIQDSPSLSFTMKQFNQNYLSAYRFLVNKLKASSSKDLSFLIQYFAEFLFLMPLTHEEGHRSILTVNGIGSISQPYFNSKGAAYVKGVKDNDLIYLRDNNLPTFIRLHTAGLESDYMLCNHMEELIMFGKEDKKNLHMGYFVKKLGLISYYTFSLFPSINPNIKEEANELDRDIVGHDIYGAVKNLYRPNIEFYRYTNYEDLTQAEKKFVKRVGYRALLNLLNPIFIKRLNLINKENIRLGVSCGYSMCPFGDFIDETFWIRYRQKYNFHVYLRQYQNRHNWFPAGGIRLVDYKISDRVNTTIAGHFWSQPQNLDFNTSTSSIGGSGDILLKYLLPKKYTKSYSLSMDFGFNYKTSGFLHEEVYLKEHFGMRFGMTINLSR